MPIDGMPWEDYLVVRFGSVARGRSFHEQIADAGKLVDVKFHFERIRRMPNSFNSHRLLLLAGAHRLETEFFDVLTEAFFVEGADIGDPDTLVGLAQLAGLPGDDARAMLDSDTYRDDILAEDRRARRIGLDGVPTFVFAGRFAVAGALAEEVFTPMFDLARSQNDRASGLNA